MGWTDLFAPTPAPIPVQPVVQGLDPLAVQIAVVVGLSVLMALIVWTYTTSAIVFTIKFMSLYIVARIVECMFFGNVCASSSWLLVPMIDRLWHAFLG